MQPVLKSAFVAASALVLSAALSGSSQAHAWRSAGPAQGYSIYQNPDGTYDSMADLSRDIWGVPCGLECTREAQARWARYGYRFPGDE
jgi:hypothetical protein